MNLHPWYELSEIQLMQELGKRLREIRLNKNITQQEIGEKIGKDRFEMSKIEHGKPISLNSFLRILRALEKLEDLEQAIQYPPISPREMMLRKTHQRKRARKK